MSDYTPFLFYLEDDATASLFNIYKEDENGNEYLLCQIPVEYKELLINIIEDRINE